MAFFKDGELKLLWPFYLDALITPIFFIYGAFFIIYFQQIGISLTQIGLLFSAIALSSLLFEIPTGAIADIFGRKFSVILGYITQSIVFILFYFTQKFYLILILYFLLGITGTFQSGAKEAWIVDLCKNKKRRKLIQESYNKEYSFSSIALLLSGFVGAFLVGKFGLSIIWLVTGGVGFLGAIMLMFANEHFVKKEQHIKEHFKDLISHTKESIKYSVKNKNLRLLIIIAGILSFSWMFISQLIWFPLLKQFGFQDAWFGYLFSVGCVFGVFVPHFTKPLIKKAGSYKKYFMVLLTIATLPLFFINFIYGLIGLLGVYLFTNVIFDFYIPVRDLFMQKFIPSKQRATISSLRMVVVSLAVMIASPLAGFCADNLGLKYTIIIGAILTIPAIILYSKIKEN